MYDSNKQLNLFQPKYSKIHVDMENKQGWLSKATFLFPENCEPEDAIKEMKKMIASNGYTILSYYFE
jgi:hypothetical protein